MDDREVFIRSIANLWTFEAAFIGRLMLALRAEGSLSAEATEAMLQELDRDCEFLEGRDDQDHATELLAHVRAVLASHEDG